MQARIVGITRRISAVLVALPLFAWSLAAAPQVAFAAPALAPVTDQPASAPKPAVKPKPVTKPAAPAPVTCRRAALRPNSYPALTRFDRKQLGYAMTIYNTARELKLPQKAAVVALSTAMQESQLYNLANWNVPDSLDIPNDGAGQDYDSVGLFQQRPLPPWGNGIWGTPKELMTPYISATKFYQALRSIPGWQNLPVTVAAQQVQGSAFPDAYAQHEGIAGALAKAISNGNVSCVDGR